MSGVSGVGAGGAVIELSSAPAVGAAWGAAGWTTEAGARSLGDAQPFVFSSPVGDRVTVSAFLFRAGRYEDKGVTITPDDLDAVCRNFKTAPPVPVKIEHRDTPLDPVGEVLAVYHKDGDLFGVLAFSAGMHAHLRERRADKVSIALERLEDGSLALKETSLVLVPRVAGAGFLTAAQVGETVARFTAQGKLTPAMAGPASRLLSAPPVAQFGGDGGNDVADAIIALLEAAPVVQARGAVGAVAFARCGGDDLPEGVGRLAERYGVDKKRVAAQMRESKSLRDFSGKGEG